MRGVWVAAAVLSICATTPFAARAQPEAEERVRDEEGSAEEDSSSEVRPPQLLALPPVQVPAGSTLRLEVRVRIDADGIASLDEPCLHDQRVCDAISEALAAGRFEPARRGDEAVASRIGLRLTVMLQDDADGQTEATEGDPGVTALHGALVPPSPFEPNASGDEDDHARPQLGVSAEVDAPTHVEHGGQTMSFERARDMPGSLGDPFRAASMMPGVTPFVSLLPYFYLRGAPITGTVYYYDGVPLPTIFHVGVGPAVVHPRLVGPIEVIPGIAPARYGRHTGGVVVGMGQPLEPFDNARAEVSLRLLDVNGYLELPLRVNGRQGSVAFAGRYGYPGLVVSAITPEIQLAYGDYAFRLDVPTVGDERFQIVWVGSHDYLDMRSAGIDIASLELASTLSFHRGEVRYLLRRPEVEVGTAIRLGYDSSELPDILSSEAFHFGPRVWFRWEEGPWTVRAGADATFTFGGLSQDSQLITTIPPFSIYAEADHRSLYGGYVELGVEPWPELDILAGVRTDLWVTEPYFSGSVDPRLRATVHATDYLDIHVAAGVARMPSVFLIPLPGLSELPLSSDLQTAVQSEVGVTLHGRTDLGLGQARVQGFVNYYDGLLFTDLRQLISDAMPPALCARNGFCRDVPLDRSAKGLSYGLEVSVRSDITRHFWAALTYTLSEVDVAAYGPDVEFVPSYDVRHVFNAVATWDSRDGFTAGLRVFVRSGESNGFPYLDDDARVAYYEQRMSPWARVDVSGAYAWDAGWARLRLGIEWINLLFFLGGEPLAIDCSEDLTRPSEACPVVNQPPLFAPNLALRGDFR